MNEPCTTAVSRPGEVHQSKGSDLALADRSVAMPMDRDTLALAKTGKRPVLKRRFGLLSMIGLACAMMQSWQGALSQLGIGLLNGGPAGLLYGLLVAWLGMLSVFVCMGELSSMAPTAGGQYHWTALLASRTSKVPLSYITGWVTMLTWIALVTATSYVTGSLMQELINFARPEYTPAHWQGLLIMWAVLIVAYFINTTFGALLPALELGFLVLHVVGFFAYLIPVVGLGTRGSAREIFTRFNDGGSWNNIGVSFWVGIQGNLAAFVGCDCAVHMSEEVYDSERTVPRSMVLSLLMNGVLAFGIMVAFLLYGGSIDALLQSESEYPYLDVIVTATGSRSAGIALVSYGVFMAFAEAVSAVSSGSRMMWSFARDHGVPFWPYIQQVNKKRALPTTAVIVVLASTGLLGLIQLGSSVALNVVVALVVEGFCCSYLCVLVPFLYHRIKGNIQEADDITDPTVDTVHGLVWGPWHIRGWLGVANNVFACCYLAVVIFWSFWPPHRDVTARSMNWSCAVLGGVTILSGVYYVIWGRKSYNGPIAEIEDLSEIKEIHAA